MHEDKPKTHIKPVLINQLVYKNQLVSACFHPMNNHLVLVFKNGSVRWVSVNGLETDYLKLPFEPVSCCINMDGDFTVFLGSGYIAFYETHFRNLNVIQIDQGFTQLSLYRNYSVLGGYRNQFKILKPSGKELRTLKLDHRTEQFTVVPETGEILVFNERKKLLSFDIEGKKRWELDQTLSLKHFQTNHSGRACFYTEENGNLVRFESSGESYFEILPSLYFRHISLNSKGNLLLGSDSHGTISFMDDSLSIFRRQPGDTDIRVLSLSPDGRYFLTVDEDYVLNIFSLYEACEHDRHYLELEQSRTVIQKECEWVYKPVFSDSRTQFLKNLMVSGRGDAIYVQDSNHTIHVMSENGRKKKKIHHDGDILWMETDHGVTHSVISGEEEIILIDFKTGDEFYLQRKPSDSLPLVNYYFNRIYIRTGSGELVSYKLNGKIAQTMRLSDHAEFLLSCEKYGIVLYDSTMARGILQFKREFRISFDDTIRSLIYRKDELVCLVNDGLLCLINLETRKIKKIRLPERGENLSVRSEQPLVLKNEDCMYYILKKDQSLVRIKSVLPDPTFYELENCLYTVDLSCSKFTCYDLEMNLVWRYKSEDPVIEYRMTQNGIAFMTEDELRFIRLKGQHDHHQDDMMQFIEF